MKRSWIFISTRSSMARDHGFPSDGASSGRISATCRAAASTASEASFTWTASSVRRRSAISILHSPSAGRITRAADRHQCALKTRDPSRRNFRSRGVLCGHMRRRATWAAAIIAIALVLSTAAPAAAHGRVFVGVGVGYPAYAYPYAYPYPYFYPYPYPFAYVPPFPGAVRPPGWIPGGWVRRYDQWGRPYRAWVPGHLQ